MLVSRSVEVGVLLFLLPGTISSVHDRPTWNLSSPKQKSLPPKCSTTTSRTSYILLLLDFCSCPYEISILYSFRGTSSCCHRSPNLISTMLSTVTATSAQTEVKGKTGAAPSESSSVEDKFFWAYTEEPHRSRRQAIIKAHPEVCSPPSFLSLE